MSMFIVAMGVQGPSPTAIERSREIFDAPMRHGHILSRNTKVGAAGSGKSHTLALLIDEPPPSQRSSTQLATRSIQVMVLAKSGDSWKRIGQIDLSQLVAKAAVAQAQQVSDVPQTDTPPASEPTCTTPKPTTTPPPNESPSTDKKGSPSTSVDTKQLDTRREQASSLPQRFAVISVHRSTIRFSKIRWMHTCAWG